jgi:hypothetical protein
MYSIIFPHVLEPVIELPENVVEITRFTNNGAWYTEDVVIYQSPVGETFMYVWRVSHSIGVKYLYKII